MSVVFFTDRDLGKQFPEHLRSAGLTVEQHTDHFKDTARDDEWLPEVGRRGWYVLSHDKRIRYRPNEKNAVMAAGVGLFILIGKASHVELARGFVASKDRVLEFVSTRRVPFIAKVYRGPIREGRYRPGDVAMWLSFDDDPS